MKYIQKRSKYNTNPIIKMGKDFPSSYKSESTNSINEMVNSDDINPEWGDTLIGGTLHRILGMGRSSLKNNEINGYVKKLDQLLGEILGKESGVEDKVEELKKDEHGSKIIATEAIKKSIKFYQDEEFEKTYSILNTVSEESMSGLPESIKNFYSLIFKKSEENVKSESDAKSVEGEKKEEEEESNLPSLYSIGDMVVYKGTDLKVTEVNDDSIKAKNSKGEEYSMKADELTKKKNEKTELINTNLEKYKKMYRDLITYCKKCDPNNKKLKQYTERIKATLGSELSEDSWNEEGRNVELEGFLQTANDICKSCEISPTHEKMRNELLYNFSLILERGELPTGEKGLTQGEKGMSTLTKGETGLVKKGETGLVKQGTGLVKSDSEASTNLPSKLIDQVLKEIKSIESSSPITPGETREVDKKLNTSKVKDLSDEQNKSLMNLLTKVKDSLLHQKTYDEIRKNQKRYYDKIDGGRAVNRKGYQTWTGKVNGILAFYKDKLPMKTITLISDSLDKTSMGNDYVTLNKQFLGIESRPNKKGSTDGDLKKDAGKTFAVGSIDNKLSFVGVDELLLSRHYSKISFIWKVKSTGYNGHITAVVLESNKKAGHFNFKFIKGLDAEWLGAYYDGKTIDTKTAIPSDKIEYENNTDLNDIKFTKDLNREVFYAQVDMSKKRISKGDIVDINYVSITQLSKDGDIDINNDKLIEDNSISNKWEIEKIGILVGSTDYKAAKSTTSPDMVSKKNKGDFYLKNEHLRKFADEFDSMTGLPSTEEESTEKEDGLKVGDEITYEKEDGSENTSTVKEILPQGDIRINIKKKGTEEFYIIKKEKLRS